MESTWYPAFISAVMLYKRAMLERSSLRFVNGSDIYADCKACDKVLCIFILRPFRMEFYKSVLMAVTLQLGWLAKPNLRTPLLSHPCT